MQHFLAGVEIVFARGIREGGEAAQSLFFDLDIIQTQPFCRSFGDWPIAGQRSMLGKCLILTSRI
jgi:hypothetical protein